jgi:hypothetical protein
MKISFVTNCLIILFLSNCLFAQPRFKSKDNRLESFEAVKEMKYNGVLIVRLKTNYVKISALEKELSNTAIKPARKKRIQGILAETIKRRDALNETMATAFLDSFSFCPIYLSYDTSANSLKNGIRKGIFLNDSLQIDPEISIPDTAKVFVAYYHDKSGNYPSDGLMIRKLLSELAEPFPHYTAVKESFLNDVNTPKLRKVILFLDNRLRSLLARAEKREK